MKKLANRLYKSKGKFDNDKKSRAKGQWKKRCLSLMMLPCVLLLLSACNDPAREDGVIKEAQLVGLFITVEVRGAKEEGPVQTSDVERVYGRIDEDTNEFVFEGIKGYSLGKIREKGDVMDSWEIPEEGTKGGRTFYSEELNRSDLIGDVAFCVDWDEEKTEWKLSGSLFYDRSGMGWTNYYSQEALMAKVDGGLEMIIQENGLQTLEGIDEVETIEGLKAFTADIENVLIEDYTVVNEEKGIRVRVGDEIIFRPCLVFQTKQGEIYFIPEEDGLVMDESGGSMRVMDEINADGAGGRRSAENYEIEILFEDVSSPVVKTIFSFYDEAKNLIREESCQSGELPQILVRVPEVAFILVTQFHEDGSRSFDMIKPEDDAYRFCISGEGPILRQKVITIQDESVSKEDAGSKFLKYS